MTTLITTEYLKELTAAVVGSLSSSSNSNNSGNLPWGSRLS